MTPIRSRKHHPARLAVLIAATLPFAALAADEPVKLAAATLPTVKVDAPVEEPPFRTRESANPKQTQPLIDTAQTVQIIKKELLREQGAVSLMEALRNTPGITMQLGEGGNTAAGDTFSMRGFSTQTSLFVDGIRDLGAVMRDAYNLEQVEVAKGPAGADIGRGAASGYINLISKLPSRDGVNMATASVGTANKLRGTVDLNQAIGKTAAVRLNALIADGDVDKRDVVSNENYAIAPSFALGLGTPTRLYLYSQHVRQDNVPDGGIPSIGMDGFYFNNTGTGGALASPAIRAAGKVDRSNFYGSPNDYEKITADMFTAKVEHDLGGGTTLRNISRYGESNLDRVLTGVGAIGFAAADPTNAALWTVSRSRQRVDQDNTILANQTSLTGEFSTGGVKHNYSAGVEFMYESQKSKTFATANQTINGVLYPAVAAPAANLYNPNQNDVLGVPYATGAVSDGKTLTAALYGFDSIEISPQWILSAGGRVERYRTETALVAVQALPTGQNAVTFNRLLTGTSLEDEDTLFSWKVGAVFKPASNGSIYAAYATSQTPPGSANFFLNADATNINNPAFDPQETTNIELGTKWDLLNEQLSFAAAIFRTENDNQVSTDPVTLQTSQFGKTRIDGVEMNIVGQINNFWQVTAGAQWLDSKALDQQSCSTATPPVCTVTDAVRWTPDFSATLWTSYTFGDLTIGGGARYVGEQKRLITAGSNAATTNMPVIPDYIVADAMVAYKISKQVNLRLNVYNLFDKEYIETLNNSGARVRLGVPRSALLTAEFTF